MKIFAVKYEASSKKPNASSVPATVVSVVIFLCGVLVGRGVRARQSGDLATLGEPTVAAEGGGQQPATGPGGTAPPPDSSVAASPPDLSYYRRLESEGTAQEKLKPGPASVPPTVVEVPPQKPAEAEKAPAAAPSASQAAPVPSSADGFVIQVAALRERAEAEALVKRLSGHGYPAFMLEPALGAPSAVFRVRVGAYKERREAEQVVRQLEKEEQFKPWITR